MYGYIYLIVNNVNGKTYIGQRKFYNKSLSLDDGYWGSGVLVKKAQMKYGIENFEKFLLQYVDTLEDANKAEIFWIDHYKKLGKAEYNIAKGGTGGGVPGHKCSEETRQKISKANKGRKPSQKTLDAAKEANKGKPAWNKGKKLGSNLAHSEFMKQRAASMTEEERKATFGRKFSEEDRKRMSEIKRGTIISESQRKKMSEAHKGKTFSEEHKRKLSIAAKKREVLRKLKNGIIDVDQANSMLAQMQNMDFGIGMPTE